MKVRGHHKQTNGEQLCTTKKPHARACLASHHSLLLRIRFAETAEQEEGEGGGGGGGGGGGEETMKSKEMKEEEEEEEEEEEKIPTPLAPPPLFWAAFQTPQYHVMMHTHAHTRRFDPVAGLVGRLVDWSDSHHHEKKRPCRNRGKGTAAKPSERVHSNPPSIVQGQRWGKRHCHIRALGSQRSRDESYCPPGPGGWRARC
jgi:hypothetical protein